MSNPANVSNFHISQLLPSVNQSEVNTTLLHSTVDELLTRDSGHTISGIIGLHPTGSQFVEPTQHRQAYQLSPVIFNAHHTIPDNIHTWSDFGSQLQLQGVDLDRMDSWGKCTGINWNPPINLDKFINYKQYCWTAPTVPHYVTIENPCVLSNSRVSGYDILIQTGGFVVFSSDVSFSTNIIRVPGNILGQGVVGDEIYITTAVPLSLRNTTWVVRGITYNSGTDITEITTDPLLYNNVVPPSSPIVGDWYYDTILGVREYTINGWELVNLNSFQLQLAFAPQFNIVDADVESNAFIVSGDVSNIFELDFKFLTSGSVVTPSIWTVVSSAYDATSNTTKAIVVEPIFNVSPTPIVTTIVGKLWVDSNTHKRYRWNGTAWVTIGAVVATTSLSIMRSLLSNLSSQLCGNTVGFDEFGFDDSQIGWNSSLMTQITFDTLLDWQAVNTETQLALWYSPLTDTLYQFNDPIHQDPLDILYAPVWVPLVSNFSSLLVLLTGDNTMDGDLIPSIKSQWSEYNAWTPISSVNRISSMPQAALPIIEYDSNVELATWVEYKYKWKYRASHTHSFADVDIQPSRIELEPILHYVLDGNVLYLYNNVLNYGLGAHHAPRNVDYSDYYQPGSTLTTLDTSGLYTQYGVASSVYRLATISDPVGIAPVSAGDVAWVTVVVLTSTPVAFPMFGSGMIVPAITSAGDNWIGYQYHWVLSDTTTVPTSTTPKHPIITSPYVIDDVSGNVAYTGFTPQVDRISYNSNSQELAVSIAMASMSGSVDIDLVPLLRYSNIANTTFAISGYEVAVYKNDNLMRDTEYTIRTTTTAIPEFVTTTGQVTLPIAVNANCIIGITIISNIQAGDIIRIEVGDQAITATGRLIVPVRTIESDTVFEAAVIANTQPVMVSLVQKKEVQQHMLNPHQHPIFNLYDLVNNSVASTGTIFDYIEDPVLPVELNSLLRIPTLSPTSDYKFIERLHDGNKLIGYRDVNKVADGDMWYSPKLNQSFAWSGVTWLPFIVSTHKSKIITSVSPPNAPNLDDLWVHPSTLNVKAWNGVLWVAYVTTIVKSNFDPSMRSAWRGSAQYIPTRVNSNREVSPTGDWEVLQPWMFNIRNESRDSITWSNSYDHFNSIITQQTSIPGLVSGGVFSKAVSEYALGRGGITKVHDNGFALIASAVADTVTSPINILSFASTQTQELLSDLYWTALRKFPTLLSTTYTTQNNISVILTDIQNRNGHLNSSTNTISNWFPSAAAFGLTSPTKPYVVIDQDIGYITHHDGHRSTITIPLAEKLKIAKSITSATINNVAIGRMYSAEPPATIAHYSALLSSPNITNGRFWYTTTNNTLYKSELYSISSGVPITPTSIGNVHVDTDTYFAYVYNGVSWILQPDGFRVIWRKVDLLHELCAIVSEIEHQLYTKAIAVPVKHISNGVVVTPADVDTHNSLLLTQFLKHAKLKGASDVEFVNNKYQLSDPNTWNYNHSTPTIPPYVTATNMKTGYWKSLYEKWYNTPYPHLEPWKLQGYSDMPDWWMSEYYDTTRARSWIQSHSTNVGMWTNIRGGVVPVGRTYPDGSVSTGNSLVDGQSIQSYQYVSVNISDVTIGQFRPDALLPPYFNTSSLSPADALIVRSVFSDYSEITSPNSDYVFLDNGPMEWDWRHSESFVYDTLIALYLMQPIRVLFNGWGLDIDYVDGVPVEVATANLITPNTTWVNKSGEYLPGFSQWYLLYIQKLNRTVDVFLSSWRDWESVLAYQTNSLIDAKATRIPNDSTAIRDVVLSRTHTTDIFDFTAVNVELVVIPSARIRASSNDKWVFGVKLAGNSDTIKFHGVHSYQFTTDNGYCTILKCAVVESPSSTSVIIKGDVRSWFRIGEGVIQESDIATVTANIASTHFDYLLDVTKIVLSTPVISNIKYIKPSNVTVPWATGTMVVLSTSDVSLPHPLAAHTPYYVIIDANVVDGKIKLAETFNESMEGISIDLTLPKEYNITISEVKTSFTPLANSPTGPIWYHYVPNELITHEYPNMFTIKGMQRLIDVVDGISNYQASQGITTSTTYSLPADPSTGRAASWEVETERFISWALTIRNLNITAVDNYACQFHPLDSTLTFTSMPLTFDNGQAIQFNTTGVLPSTLTSGTKYYLHNTTNGIRVSVSPIEADIGMYVGLPDIGSGQHTLHKFTRHIDKPEFVLNPFRNGIVVKTPKWISNITESPYGDIFSDSIITDQYNRPLRNRDIMVYRYPDHCVIKIRPNIMNNVERFYSNDPYHFIHLSAGKLFASSFEHVVLFNRDSRGRLIYDSIIGAYRPFLHYETYTIASSIDGSSGGYYNHNYTLERNIEGTVDDFTNSYDTYHTPNPFVDKARELIGHNIDPYYKTQMGVSFFRGFIANKGSTVPLIAHNNSLNWNVSIDEVWAVPVTTFGHGNTTEYTTISGVSKSTNNKQLFFIDDITKPIFNLVKSEVDVVDIVELSTNAEPIIPVGKLLPMDITHHLKIWVGPQAPTTPDVHEWYDTDNRIRYTKSRNEWVPVASTQVFRDSTHLYFTHSVSDDVIVSVTPVPVDIIEYAISFGVDDRIILEGELTNAIVTPSPVTVVILGEELVGTILTSTFDISTQRTTLTHDIPVVLSAGIIRAVTNTPAIAESQLLTNNVDYTKLNNEVVKIPYINAIGILEMWLVNPSTDINTPILAVDAKRPNDTRYTIPMWHPAIGMHHYSATIGAPLRTSTDPAEYGIDGFVGWSTEFVGKIWVNTTTESYVPYYDPTIYHTVTERINNWGKLRENASPSVLKWIESPVHPSVWDRYVASRTGVGGIALQESYIGTRVIISGLIDYTNSTIAFLTDSVLSEDVIVFDSTSNIPSPLEANIQYTTDTNIDGSISLLDSISSIAFDQPAFDVTVKSIKVGEIATDLTSFGDKVKYVLTTTGSVVDGDIVEFTTTELLPDGIEGRVRYHINLISVAGGITTFSIRSTVLTDVILAPAKLDTVASAIRGRDIYISSIGSGVLTANVLFRSTRLAHAFGTRTGWIPLPPLSERISAFGYHSEPHLPILSPKLQLTLTKDWVDGDFVEIYVNGKFINNTTISKVGDYFEAQDKLLSPLYPKDMIEIVRASVPDLGDPTTSDDGTRTAWTWTDYKFNTRLSVDPVSGIPFNRYYFWVVNDLTDVDVVSIIDSTNLIYPYYFAQIPSSGQHHWNNMAIMRNVPSNQELSYKFNHAQSRSIHAFDSKYVEWEMLSAKQDHHIPKRLWDMLTESIIGKQLITNKPLPSPAYAIEDNIHHKNHRFGITDGRIINTKADIIRIISIHLPTIVISGTSNELIQQMDTIYYSVPHTIVNAIWFDVVLDMLSKNKEAKGILKTSWIKVNTTHNLLGEEI
jgi:hypothetical protein